MTYFIAFFAIVFLVSFRQSGRGREFRFRHLFVLTTALAMSFYTLRAIS